MGIGGFVPGDKAAGDVKLTPHTHLVWGYTSTPSYA
jgi:hypothetical protein